VSTRFYGYAAANKCCRDWLLLGWPSDEDGQPQGRDLSRDPVFGSECPKCGRMIYFDLAHPDISASRDEWRDTLGRAGVLLDESRGATLVGGRIRVR
jgi:hypothetical protein